MNDSPETQNVLPEITDAALLPELRTLIVETEVLFAVQYRKRESHGENY
jgi:hypothetical protein